LSAPFPVGHRYVDNASLVEALRTIGRRESRSGRGLAQEVKAYPAIRRSGRMQRLSLFASEDTGSGCGFA
jgi:hypothetical protein